MDAATKQVVTAVDKITIYFRKLSDAEISSYIKSGEPFGKAGGYNLQGLGFNLIQKIEGDFSCALGLPMTIVFNALEKLGVHPVKFRRRRTSFAGFNGVKI
jgi:septum formation protein